MKQGLYFTIRQANGWTYGLDWNPTMGDYIVEPVWMC